MADKKNLQCSRTGMEVIVDARRIYRSDPQVFEAVINKLRQGNRVIAAAAEMLLEKARGDVECLL